MRKVVIALAVVLVLLVCGALGWKCSGCGQKAARSWGGTITVDLPAGTSLVTATWKDDEVWYLVRPHQPDERPVTSEFIQKKASSMSLEGRVVFQER
ncbi:MAG: hypothetical protein V1723_04465 [Candidatus Uhrbacteria bacterium]